MVILKEGRGEKDGGRGRERAGRMKRWRGKEGWGKETQCEVRGREGRRAVER